MKKIILFLAALLLISCSDDDGNKTKNLFLESIVVANGGSTGGVIEFTYNDKKQIETFGNKDTQYLFKYEDDRLISITNTKDNTILNRFGYQNGQLNKMEVNGVEYDVTYKEENKEYIVEGLDRSFTLNDENDVASITDPNTEPYVFTYEPKYKGAMYSVKSIDTYLIAFVFNAPYLLSRRAVKDFGGNTFVNTYNDDGYLKRAELTLKGESEPSSVIYYNYTEL